MKKLLLILISLPLFFCFVSAYSCTTLTSRMSNFLNKLEDYNYRYQILAARHDKVSNEYEASLWFEEYYRLEAERDILDSEHEIITEEKEWCDDLEEKYNDYLDKGDTAKKKLIDKKLYDKDLVNEAIKWYQKAYDLIDNSNFSDPNKKRELIKKDIEALKEYQETQEARIKAEKKVTENATVQQVVSQTETTTTINTATGTKRNNRFSDEYNDAYEFAYANKITTMPTIEEANMYNPIIRAEIAKMLANWVKSLGYTPDTSAKCNFTDIGGVKGDLYTAIIESCQLGIMGQGITKFRPFDNITRGEVATAVSRILRGHQYDGGNPFYALHINALFYNGVLPNADNAELSELRGSVMLILMNASNKVLGKGSSSNASVDDVVDYNDKILDLTAGCIDNEDEISNLVDNGASSKEIEKATNVVINKCKNSIQQLTKLGGWEGDTSLKDGALKYIALNVIYYQQFLELVPYLDIDNLSVTQEKQYNSILEEMDETNEKLDDMSEDLENIQKKFAKKFGYQLEG